MRISIIPIRFHASSTSSEQLVPFQAIRMQECPDRKGEAAFAWCHGCAKLIRAKTKCENPSEMGTADVSDSS